MTNLRGLLKSHLHLQNIPGSFDKSEFLMQENVSGLANRGYAGDLLKGLFNLIGSDHPVFLSFTYRWLFSSFTYRWLLFQVRLGGNSSLETRTLFLPGLHSPKPPFLLHHNFSPI